jgi:SAM-dependent methyltransferase
MTENFRKFLKPGGKLLIDWGLGDHWRFENYKVGWVKDGEHEWAYEEDNFLWSYIWDDEYEFINTEVIKFKDRIKKLGYDGNNLKDIIKNEVPVIFIAHPGSFGEKNMKISHLALWEDLPQLYTCLLLEY